MSYTSEMHEEKLETDVFTSWNLIIESIDCNILHLFHFCYYHRLLIVVLTVDIWVIASRKRRRSSPRWRLPYSYNCRRYE